MIVLYTQKSYLNLKSNVTLHLQSKGTQKLKGLQRSNFRETLLESVKFRSFVNYKHQKILPFYGEKIKTSDLNHDQSENSLLKIQVFLPYLANVKTVFTAHQQCSSEAANIASNCVNHVFLPSFLKSFLHFSPSKDTKLSRNLTCYGFCITGEITCSAIINCQLPHLFLIALFCCS